MGNMMDELNLVCVERALGTKSNEDVLNFFEGEAIRMGYEITSLPFECNLWESGRSYIAKDGEEFEIFPGPFSKAYSGSGETVIVNSLNALKKANLTDKIVFLKDQIAKESFQPKNFPFYYPEEHKEIIELLEKKNPNAIIAVTGKNPMSGLDPFPLFEDGNFSIPTAYMSEPCYKRLLNNDGEIALCINSKVLKAKSRQIIVSKRGIIKDKGRIVVCAHMDTKYGTPGTLDNGSGVLALLEVMKNLKNYITDYNIEFVPFNGEEYYEATGEVEYLKYLANTDIPVKLLINIDTIGHRGAKSALSVYNFKEGVKSKLINEIIKSENIIEGEKWYAGDHSMFAFQGIPCIAVTSSDLFEAVLQLTHTKDDTADKIDCDLIKSTSSFLSEAIYLLQHSSEV